MQKNWTTVASLLIFSMLVISCARKSAEHQESPDVDTGVWPEMESFHMVMAEAYHPYKDEKNLEPVKSLAANLAREAEKWSASPLPEKVNTEAVKASLEKLKVDSRKLADLVKAGGTDEQIGASLTELHTSFHAIMEIWEQGGGEENEKHESH